MSWKVQRRERVGLVGGTGAGKTTQLRLIADLEEPSGVCVAKDKEKMKIDLLIQKIEVRATQTGTERNSSTPSRRRWESRTTSSR